MENPVQGCWSKIQNWWEWNDIQVTVVSKSPSVSYWPVSEFAGCDVLSIVLLPNYYPCLVVTVADNCSPVHQGYCMIAGLPHTAQSASVNEMLSSWNLATTHYSKLGFRPVWSCYPALSIDSGSSEQWFKDLSFLFSRLLSTLQYFIHDTHFHRFFSTHKIISIHQSFDICNRQLFTSLLFHLVFVQMFMVYPVQ